ncbi:YihA family ribosome biogenesis GTP-binding protein [Rickettsiales endosymbiont of Paramecium tredecaurelia]|uniref:ribosome biogenesis GTP-binding protein YihA/YsxC n=1 Tax=Candidatus Sarmatiella mevalonica TaxID=2770581 RepID=UPI001922C6E0|nr:ribosome biogenesis GTP-binding protein YihA/YsxC [Candidatus Sarmatiella mevalonica]MBL3285126.1 YihA family ribosome biogenesis GTP-binding protein [Candidatus Sarmatiella mevalonica]
MSFQPARYCCTKVFNKSIEFIAGTDKPKLIPNYHYSEVAFIGKSNVGKSSLINALCKRKNLARVAHTPGRTQQLNFFRVDEKFVIVDMPGYGFANVPRSLKANWEELIVYYLSNRENLRMTYLLIDARRGIARNDLMVLEMLNQLQKKHTIIFTKCDKIKNQKLLLQQAQNALSKDCDCQVRMLCCSSKDGENLSLLRQDIISICY